MKKCFSGCSPRLEKMAKAKCVRKMWVCKGLNTSWVKKYITPISSSKKPSFRCLKWSRGRDTESGTKKTWHKFLCWSLFKLNWEVAIKFNRVRRRGQKWVGPNAFVCRIGVTSTWMKTMTSVFKKINNKTLQRLIKILFHKRCSKIACRTRVHQLLLIESMLKLNDWSE